MHRKLLPDSCDHIFSYLIYKYNMGQLIKILYLHFGWPFYLREIGTDQSETFNFSALTFKFIRVTTSLCVQIFT